MNCQIWTQNLSTTANALHYAIMLLSLSRNEVSHDWAPYQFCPSSVCALSFACPFSSSTSFNCCKKLEMLPMLDMLTDRMEGRSVRVGVDVSGLGDSEGADCDGWGIWLAQSWICCIGCCCTGCLLTQSALWESQTEVGSTSLCGPMAWRWLPLGTGVLPWGLGGRPERWLQGCELYVLWWLVLGRLVLRCWEMLLRWWQWLEYLLMPFTAVDLVKGFIQETLKLAGDMAVQVIGQLEQHWGDVLTVAAPHWIACLSALDKIFDKNKQLILLFFCLLKLVRKLCLLVRFLPVVCVGGRHSCDIFCGWLRGQNYVGAEPGIILAMGGRLYDGTALGRGERCSYLLFNWDKGFWNYPVRYERLQEN